jgi:XTP/dITP diphosphohydrolase
MRMRLCSQNAHKLAELRTALPDWELELLPVDVEETGATYDENARLKARAGREHAAPGEWVLGERSARWAPPGEQAEALLKRLLGEPDRVARMVTELVALSPEGAELRAAGVLPGRIATERRGTAGFGYDPVFVPDGFEQTVAELGDEWKRANSHRARAARALREALGS